MLRITLGDITVLKTQAIVNSANPSLLAGGGVCGAIHRAAGPQLEVACRSIGKIEPGQAVITSAFNLPADYVIHAVAPRYLDGQRNEAATLRQAYASVCRVIEETEITQVTLPSLGTGIYRFPIELAAKIAFETVLEHLSVKCDATFVCFDLATLTAYEQALGRSHD
ncbi:MAG: macro domain-containing protein [Pseudomonadota bacterium]